MATVAARSAAFAGSLEQIGIGVERPQPAAGDESESDAGERRGLEPRHDPAAKLFVV